MLIIVTFFSIFNHKNTKDNKRILKERNVIFLISYSPLWKTMEEKGVTTYTLINKYNISSRTINNLKHDKGITVFTLERLCEILSCTPNDIIEFIKE